MTPKSCFSRTQTMTVCDKKPRAAQLQESFKPERVSKPLTDYEPGSLHLCPDSSSSPSSHFSVLICSTNSGYRWPPEGALYARRLLFTRLQNESLSNRIRSQTDRLVTRRTDRRCVMTCQKAVNRPAACLSERSRIKRQISDRTLVGWRSESPPEHRTATSAGANT